SSDLDRSTTQNWSVGTNVVKVARIFVAKSTKLEIIQSDEYLKAQIFRRADDGLDGEIRGFKGLTTDHHTAITQIVLLFLHIRSYSTGFWITLRTNIDIGER